MRNSVFVSGCSGFIGYNLCLELVRSGFQVIGLDSLIFGRNLNELGAGFTFIRRDLCTINDHELLEVLSDCEYVIHLAATKLNNAGKNYNSVIQTNVAGSHRLFELAGRAGVSFVFNASSLYVYPMTGESGFKVGGTNASPFTEYGVSKLTTEFFLSISSKRYGFSFLNARLFFVYGPYQFSGLGYPSVIVRSMERIKKGLPPLIYGSGEQSLDYVYVGDVVAFILERIRRRDIGNDTINLGTGRAVSINNLVDEIVSISGSNFQSAPAVADWTDGTVRFDACDLARGSYGWNPQIDLKSGLIETWEWIQQMGYLIDD